MSWHDSASATSTNGVVKKAVKQVVPLDALAFCRRKDQRSGTKHQRSGTKPSSKPPADARTCKFGMSLSVMVCGRHDLVQIQRVGVGA